MLARERLDAARSALRKGDNEAALAGLIWFHEHALEESRGWAGVRLSYALNDWTALATRYPPALNALRETRERTAMALFGATGDRHDFHDIVSIDDKLGQAAATYRLFLRLEHEKPALAIECGPLILEALILERDFARAAKVLPVSEQSICKAGAALDRDMQFLKHAKFTRSPTRWAFTVNYLEKVRNVIAIAKGLGQTAEATALARLAVSQVRDPALRRSVKAGLVRWPPAPRIGHKRYRLQTLRARRRATAERRRARIMRSL